jgi:hypothetical protein
VAFGSRSRAVHRLRPAARSVGRGVAPADRMVALVSPSREIPRRMRCRRHSGGYSDWRARAGGRSWHENRDGVTPVNPRGMSRVRRSTEVCHLSFATRCRSARPPATNRTPPYCHMLPRYDPRGRRRRPGAGAAAPPGAAAGPGAGPGPPAVIRSYKGLNFFRRMSWISLELRISRSSAFLRSMR